MGPRFQLSRSVRQGCLLALTLFLFFVEAMSWYPSSCEVGLQGLRLPIRGEDLLDAEFADDTAMYLDGTMPNLLWFHEAMKFFCAALGAKINWHKSCGLWGLGRASRPNGCLVLSSSGFLLGLQCGTWDAILAWTSWLSSR